MDLSTLIYSECQNPQQISIYNGITNRYEMRNVPCGKCYHCKITKINEWVTRMVIQSKDSKYVYFGTLTYSSLKPTSYIYDCLPCNFDKNPTTNDPNFYKDVPMVLRKDHVQKFLKRLRKNTGIKLQYAYCGEYGSKKSRPHYHYIIWSNDPIKKSDIYKAWRAPSLADPKRTNIIGRIDHVDIKNNPRQVEKNGDVDAVYKYVCKYIQKYDFKFNELTNYKQHEKNFYYWFQSVTRISSKIDPYFEKYEIKTFDDYQTMARPFFHCSKKPAIGYNYFVRHIERFQNADFRLFEVSGKYIFPLYFIRKTKESLCPIKAQSETNDNTTSYSRIPKMVTLLENIISAGQIAEQTNFVVRTFEYNGNTSLLEYYGDIHDLKLRYDDHDKANIIRRHYILNRDYLGFTNHETKIKYIFCGNCYSMFSTTTGMPIGTETLENVTNLIKYYYEQLKRKILLPLLAKSEISANKKETLIKDNYKDVYEFNEHKALCVDMLNRQVAARQKKYKQTKTLE